MNLNNESLITFPSVTTELEAALIVYLLLLAEQEIDATQSERLTLQFQAEAWGLSRSWCCRIRGLLTERSSQKTILWTHDTNLNDLDIDYWMLIIGTAIVLFVMLAFVL